MELNSTEELIEDIRQGKMIILMDDEDRENEGDLIMAAEFCAAEHINFMARHARGLICMPLTKERCQQLGLPLMVSDNNAQHGTAFTVSIEAAKGVTTGISAADRARTVQAAVARDARPEDIVQPGHIFPLMAQPGGVLNRAGHTEAGCDLARLAGCEPAAVIVEIMNEDGTMARRPDLEIFAKTHNLKIGTIADLIHHQFIHEQTIDLVDRGQINTDYGGFELTTFRNNMNGEHHFALSKGEITPDKPTLVRVHLPTVARDLFCAQPPEQTIWNINRCLSRIAKEGQGVLVIMDNRESDQELYQSVLSMMGKQPPPNNFSHSNVYKTIGVGAQILRHMGVGKMRVMGQEFKYRAISGFDLEVIEHIACD
ncbi:MAG: 3,4-dihydroxy-2-butanone-4-phosphate synthase [Pseudomonadales bacterium]|nr:3,4-dihydroxy-2-butanone-4-phosphate synthase [Pseudomonadales bacterium]